VAQPVLIYKYIQCSPHHGFKKLPSPTYAISRLRKAGKNMKYVEYFQLSESNSGPNLLSGERVAFLSLRAATSFRLPRRRTVFISAGAFIVILLSVIVITNASSQRPSHPPPDLDPVPVGCRKWKGVPGIAEDGCPKWMQFEVLGIPSIYLAHT
jgi:hypothetical protein